ncbi:MAG: hypothetical protein ACM3OH_08400 [Bacillota bacterium]|jgi:hypothetical protein
MIPLLALLLFQGRPPTVGDTIWVTRRVAVPAGHAVRAGTWELTGDVELLGRPRVTTAGGVGQVAWPLVVWTPGSHTVSVPGPLVLAADGTVDSLPPADTTLNVASVLPRNAPVSALQPQPQAGIVHRRTVTWLPLLLLTGAALLLLAPLHWWWRRRGPRALPPESPAVATPPLVRWAEAGETRTVLAAAAARLRGAVAAKLGEAGDGLSTPALVARLAVRPELPAGEIAGILQALDDARFAGTTPTHAAELYERASSLAVAVGAPVEAAP